MPLYIFPSNPHTPHSLILNFFKPRKEKKQQLISWKMFGSSDHYPNAIGIRALVMERGTTTTKWKYNTNTSSEVAPNCPRCASTNTKFCYYNNYSLSQPRYFCKACRRYWTKGGSLRNVPVGGGCRKSRRARAAARHQGRSSAGPTLTPMGPTDDGGACIDMAAVFAKYVNHDGEINEESDSPGGSSGSSSDYNVQTSCSLEIDSQVEDVTLMFEYQKPLDLLVNGGGDHDQIQQVMIPHFSTCQDVIGQDYLYQDCNANFELQQVDSVLGDELVADIIWSEGTALPNLGSQQPLMQLQEFGLLSTDDHLRMSANLVPDNWGSFDLSAYDFYSTP